MSTRKINSRKINRWRARRKATKHPRPKPTKGIPLNDPAVLPYLPRHVLNDLIGQNIVRSLGIDWISIIKKIYLEDGAK